MRSDKYSMKKNKRKRLFETLLSIAILLAIFVGGVTGYYGSKVMSFFDNISVQENEGNNEEIETNTQQLEDLEPFSVLILGTDIDGDGEEEEEITGDGENSRSDTIIVATINPESNDIKMISIPRDTLITLPNGNEEKINAAYTSGGASLARETISDYLDIPIHFYAQMDFDGLVKLVDAVDGVTVDSDLDFTQSDYTSPGEAVHIKEGTQELDGAGALAYARMRKKDPQGDFGRQERQQEVIIGLLDKLSSFNTITNLTAVLDAVGSNLETNATTQQILSIASSYADTTENVEQLTLTGEARTTYFPHYGLNVYVWEAYQDSLNEVHHELEEHLDYNSTKNADDFDPTSLAPSTSEQSSME